jgi:preprotein translocase subunit YajC
VELILPFLMLVAVAYLFVVVPRRQQARRTADLNAHLSAGVEVITTAGVIGKVLRVDADEVQLEIAPGVVIRLLKGGIGKILTPDEATALADPNPGGTSADEGGMGSGPASPKSH